MPLVNPVLAQLLLAITAQYSVRKNQYPGYTVSVQTFPFVGGILVQTVVTVVFFDVPTNYVLDSYLVPYELLPPDSYQETYDAPLGPGQCGPAVFDILAGGAAFYDFMVNSSESGSTPLGGMAAQLTRITGILDTLPNYPWAAPPGGPGDQAPLQRRVQAAKDPELFDGLLGS